MFFRIHSIFKKNKYKAKRIEVIKKWPKSKSIQNIKVFLGFTNIYQQFIQSFSRIAALLILILKTTGSSDKPPFGRNNSSRLTLNRNNNNKSASKKIDGNGEVDGFSIDSNSIEHAKNLERLKGQKLFKFQKLSKLRKMKSEKLAKSG